MRKKEGGGRRGIYASREEEEEDDAASGLIWKSPSLMTGVGGAVGRRWTNPLSLEGRKLKDETFITIYTVVRTARMWPGLTKIRPSMNVCLMAYFLVSPLFVHLCKRGRSAQRSINHRKRVKRGPPAPAQNMNGHDFGPSRGGSFLAPLV